MSKSLKKDKSITRNPVVAVLGHVDHGKTTLLDAIRQTNVQDSEVGGITQSIRAHKVVVNTKSGVSQTITFIDTPGHEAFSEMRSRGAKVTDISLLIVAADDGVMPQTKEAIKFIQNSKTPIIVAINKIDLPGADIPKVKQQLSQEGVLLEEYGGDVLAVEISAKNKLNLDELLETILLVAEVNGLKDESSAGFKGKAVVLESTKSQSLGATSFSLVKAGTFNVGDYLAWDGGYSKLRSLKDEFFKDQKEAIVSDPVWIVGLTDVIRTGESVFGFKTEKDAKLHAEKKEEEKTAQEKVDISPEDLFASLMAKEDDTDKKVLKVVIKTDVQGSLEVLEKELEKLNDEDVSIKIIDKGTGDISEKDIARAKSTGSVVLAFRTKLLGQAKRLADKDHVIVMSYELIYELLDDIDEAMSGLLDPEEKETEIATAKIKKLYILTNGNKVAGCEVTSGTIKKGYMAFARRGEERLGEGKIVSLKNLKNEVKEAAKGTECGILLDPQVSIEDGDELVCFKKEKF